MKPTVILAITVALALAFHAFSSGEQEGTSSLNTWRSHGPKLPVNYCRHDAMCRDNGPRVGPKPKHACCSNRCVDLKHDRNNCGACRQKCRFNEACCGACCVRLSSDMRHCGACNRACKHGRRCVYGMCDYA